MFTIRELVSFQRALNKLSKNQLHEFVSTLETTQVRWLLSNYLKTFLPHHSQNPKKPYPSINSVHSERLNNIPNNPNDASILLQMKESFVDNYLNNISRRNPLSINTSHKRKNDCTFLKTISKNLLSHVISFLSFNDRASCCQTSYPIYQACNDPIGKHQVFLSSSLLRQVVVKKNVDCEQISGYKKVEFESEQNVGFLRNSDLNATQVYKLLSNCQHLSINGNHRFSQEHIINFLSDKFLLSIKNNTISNNNVLSNLNSLDLVFCPQQYWRMNQETIQSLTKLFAKLESLLKQCIALEKLSVRIRC